MVGLSECPTTPPFAEVKSWEKENNEANYTVMGVSTQGTYIIENKPLENLKFHRDKSTTLGDKCSVIVIPCFPSPYLNEMKISPGDEKTCWSVIICGEPVGLCSSKTCPLNIAFGERKLTNWRPVFMKGRQGTVWWSLTSHMPCIIEKALIFIGLTSAWPPLRAFSLCKLWA